MGLFQRLNEEQGITIIFVTHEPDIAAHTRRVVRLADGQIVEDRPIANPRRANGQVSIPADGRIVQPGPVIGGGA
jgi:putative ABC transport system ATP-binding protein